MNDQVKPNSVQELHYIYNNNIIIIGIFVFEIVIFPTKDGR